MSDSDKLGNYLPNFEICVNQAAEALIIAAMQMTDDRGNLLNARMKPEDALMVVNLALDRFKESLQWGKDE